MQWRNDCGFGDIFKWLHEKMLRLNFVSNARPKYYYIYYKIVVEVQKKEKITRKLSYRKDDRAMRPMYGCPDNFRESLTTPTATFPEIFNGLLFRLSL